MSKSHQNCNIPQGCKNHLIWEVSARAGWTAPVHAQINSCCTMSCYEDLFLSHPYHSLVRSLL